MSAQNRGAFVSHTYDDRQRAEELARALRAHGVASWLDKWEIKPGDSIVQKVFEDGLRECGVFLILLSESSVQSRWVREELDAAIIRRIEGSTRVIPIRLDSCEVPIALRALKYVDFSNGVEVAAKQIADVVFGVRVAPPVAPPPTQLSFDVAGLSRLAARVAVHLWPSFETRTKYDGKRLVTELGLTADDVNDAIEELEGRGLVELRRWIGMSPFNFGNVWPTYALAHELRGTPVMSYDPEDDVMVVANAVVNARTIDGRQLAVATNLSPVRINAAVEYLEHRSLVKVLRAMGGFMQVTATGVTRRFVANEG